MPGQNAVTTQILFRRIYLFIYKNYILQTRFSWSLISCYFSSHQPSGVGTKLVGVPHFTNSQPSTIQSYKIYWQHCSRCTGAWNSTDTSGTPLHRWWWKRFVSSARLCVSRLVSEMSYWYLFFLLRLTRASSIPSWINPFLHPLP